MCVTMQDPVGSIHPGPLLRPVCLLSRVPALPASGPSPDQGQQCLLDCPDLHHHQCLLDCPGLHHHQSQVPKKYLCHLIHVHGRTLTPSSPPTAWCLDQTVHPQGMQSRGPHCWPQRQWSSPPTSAPDLPAETACPLGLSPLPRRLAPTWLVQGSRLLLDLRPPPAWDPASRQAPMDPTEQTPGTRDLSTQQPHGGEASSLSRPPRDPPRATGREWTEGGTDPSVGAGTRMQAACVREAAQQVKQGGLARRGPEPLPAGLGRSRAVC